MAYVYDDFVKAANGAGMMSKFSQQDLQAAQKNPEYGLSMLSLMKDLDSAETEEQRLLATEAANQLRKTYGTYSQPQTVAGSFKPEVDLAGTTAQKNVVQSGSIPITLDPGVPKPQETNNPYQNANEQKIAEALSALGSYGDFQYGNEEAYNQLLQSIINQQPFSYDPESDPRFASYKKTYLREGDRATANALAQVSAATGGVPSSYAATAAAQAGNYYAGKVADVIPQLYDAAYNQYMNDFQMKLSGLGALQEERNFSYEDYLNQFNMLQNNLNELQEQEQTEYERFLNNWNMNRTEEEDAYEKALAQYEMLGYATPEIAKILGINADLNQKQILALQKAMNSLGSNIAADGILGSQTNTALQKLGYMNAWPAYQAMMEQGLIDAQGNYVGPEVKYKPTTYISGDREKSNYQTVLERYHELKKIYGIKTADEYLQMAKTDGLVSGYDPQNIRDYREGRDK